MSLRGDKGAEMKLVPMSSYISAIKFLIDRFKISGPPSIFLTTEDAAAVLEMRNAISHDRDARLNGWQLFTFENAHFKQQHTRAKKEPKKIRSMMLMNNLTDGMLGYNSLLALLIAMEADYYVLTTGSNWSRLINELRLNIVDRFKKLRGDGQCALNGRKMCSFMIDLKKSGRNGDE